MTRALTLLLRGAAYALACLDGARVRRWDDVATARADARYRGLFPVTRWSAGTALALRLVLLLGVLAILVSGAAHTTHTDTARVAGRE